jgi:hypothetical protein
MFTVCSTREIWTQAYQAQSKLRIRLRPVWLVHAQRAALDQADDIVRDGRSLTERRATHLRGVGFSHITKSEDVWMVVVEDLEGSFHEDCSAGGDGRGRMLDTIANWGF